MLDHVESFTQILGDTELAELFGRTSSAKEIQCEGG